MLVRAKDELAAVKAFWDAMERQTIFDQAEILFLDGGSTDGTLEYLAEKPCNLYALVGKFNYGTSCNQLAELATSPHLMYLSGHVLLEQSHALETVLAALETHPNAAMYLRQIPNTILGFTAYEAAHLRRRFPEGDALVEKIEPAAFSNAASALPRTAWQRQPFQDVHGSEDYLWIQQHLAAGGRLFYMPQITAMHSHAQTAKHVHNYVRLSVVAKGLTGSYGKAAYLLGGVYVSMRREGAGHSEALEFAWAHASAYL